MSSWLHNADKSSFPPKNDTEWFVLWNFRYHITMSLICAHKIMAIVSHSHHSHYKSLFIHFLPKTKGHKLISPDWTCGSLNSVGTRRTEGLDRLIHGDSEANSDDQIESIKRIILLLFFKIFFLTPKTKRKLFLVSSLWFDCDVIDTEHCYLYQCRHQSYVYVFHLVLDSDDSTRSTLVSLDEN